MFFFLFPRLSYLNNFSLGKPPPNSMKLYIKKKTLRIAGMFYFFRVTFFYILSRIKQTFFIYFINTSRDFKKHFPRTSVISLVNTKLFFPLSLFLPSSTCMLLVASFSCFSTLFIKKKNFFPASNEGFVLFTL